MTTTHSLTIKGQVTVPKAIRDYLGLSEGNSGVEFSIAADGSVVLRKAAKVRPASQAKCVVRAAFRTPARSERPAGVLALLAGAY